MRSINLYSVVLGVLAVVAIPFLLCEPNESLTGWQFISVVAITKSIGAALIVAVIRLGEKWEKEGKINLKSLNNDTSFE